MIEGMPDRNSIPTSTHAQASSPGAPDAPDGSGERAVEQRPSSSDQMPPPPVPPPGSSSPSLHILPSNQSTVNKAHSFSLPSPPIPPFPASAAPDASSSPLPQRHPRPLTAADLHLQLEKEQEAVVNRLNRELVMLRAAHNESATSNASSTSTSGNEPIRGGDGHGGTGLSHARAALHHRTSSNASGRSFTAHSGPVSAVLTGVSSPAPVRPNQASASIGGSSLSRQNSSTSGRSHAESLTPITSSQTSTPVMLHSGPGPSDLPGLDFSKSLNTSNASVPGSGFTEMSPASLAAPSRHEDTVLYRQELEHVKRENEMLKRRLRELERTVRNRRTSDASKASRRARSSSSSTTASVTTTASATVPSNATVLGGTSIAAQRDVSALARDRPRMTSSLSTAGSVGVGVPEEELKVGESAASAGVGEV